MYTINDAADVSPERLRRFFNKDGDAYRVKREIREMILFANHNFIKDPPFSNIDLITCRNVLIYLNRSAQERVLETFHFALRPGGFLFLGSAESADIANDLYANYHRDTHIFQKKLKATSRQFPLPEATPAIKIDLLQTSRAGKESTHSRNDRGTFGELHHRLLEEYAPPSVLVNAEYEIVHLSERAGRYLQIGGGDPSQNLLKLIRQELRLELRSALYQAVQRLLPVEARGVKVTIEDRTETLNIHVRPVLNAGDVAKGYILVIFEHVLNADTTEVLVVEDEPVARQLEEELIRLKGQLRVSNEQHEFHAEELKASNEELQAMNEEMRSAAEELETSKEELQSINEELRTVNQELKVKVEETTISSNNLHNLINSVDIGTIFLDRSFRLAFFTPAARDLFNLINSDHGRPLSDITGKINYDHLLEDCEFVLEKLQSVEREVLTTDDRVFVMRVLPYRTSEDRINGVVITFFDVTARKRVEEALRRSEERWRLLIESAQDYAIFTFDSERNVNSWNAGAEAMMGYSEKEIIGQPGDILFTPEDRKNGQPQKEVQKARDDGVAENERWHVRKNGSRFYGSGTVRPVCDTNGKVLGFVKIMRDLTEAKRIEEANYFLASIVESTEDSILTINFDGIITSFNKSAEALYGLRASEAIGKPLSLITIPGDLTRLLKDIKRVKNSRTVEIFDTVSIQKDNELISLEVVLSPVKNSEGEIIGVSVVARNVTKRKRAEQALSESEQRFRAIVSQTAAGIIQMDRQGKLTLVNSKYCDMVGYHEHELIGKEIWTFTHKDDQEKNKSLYRKLDGEGKLFDIEKRLVRKDGSVLWVSENVSITFDDAGNPDSTIAAILDITDRKKLQEQKDEFISIASHELKTPITSIKAYAQLLQERLEKKDTEKDSAALVRKLNNQVERISVLIGDLLDTSKIAEGRLVLHAESFDLDNLIKERIDEFEGLTDIHELVFRPQRLKPLKADKERIGQVITNLITNAIKYSPAGGVVIISAEGEAQGITVNVKDEGIGIPMEFQAKVFDRFFRVNDAGTTAFQGMGLGLYISAEIIQRHGGKLSVKSTLGKGSEFYFTLPYNNGEAPAKT